MTPYFGLLLLAIAAWAGCCLFLMTSHRLGEAAAAWTLVFGFVAGYILLYGSVPMMHGDVLSMSLDFIAAKSGYLGVAAALGGAAFGGWLGQRYQVSGGS